MSWLTVLELLAPWIAIVCNLVVAVVATLHALLRKREVRATIGWVVLIWLVPVVGPILYLVLGVNRIRRAAKLARSRMRSRQHSPAIEPLDPEEVAAQVGAPHLAELVRVTNSVADRPMVPGNRVEPLHNGDEAYPAMLDAIASAQHSVSLATYIFDVDDVGEQFIDALSNAVDRGVSVRVLVDAAGARYGRPRVDRVLKKHGIPVASFMAAGRVRSWVYLNLRLHRKILVVDGKVGFTGGMNIRQDHLLSTKPKFEVLDCHFRIEGPVTAQLQDVFAEDWEFTTGEVLDGESWFPELRAAGTSIARGIADGPDEDLDKMPWTLGGAIACAERSVRVMTPYFLPGQAMSAALNIAAMRGVDVDIAIPHRTNIPLAEWAAVAQLPHTLGRGCRVHRTRPPFEHSKLMIVDRAWVFFGSGNWDARSLRLNFEFNVECYEPTLAARLDDYVLERIQSGAPVSLDRLRAIPIPLQIRNGLARLFMPYL